MQLTGRLHRRAAELPLTIPVVIRKKLLLKLPTGNGMFRTMDPLRIAVLDLQDPDARSRQTESSFSLKQFENFLDDPPNDSTAGNQRHLYVVQAPSSCYEAHSPSKLTYLLRTKLGVPAEVFQIHQWRQTTFRFNETINCHRLPTTFYPKAKYSLEYFELWSVEKDAFLGRYMGITNTVICAMTGRQIQCHKWSNSSSWLMIVPRKCTYWSRTGARDSNGKQLLHQYPNPTVKYPLGTERMLRLN